MDAGNPKAVLQLIIGARQSFDIVAAKKSSSKVVGDVAKVINSFTERSSLSFLLPHL
jgi:hypothetical protein